MKKNSSIFFLFLLLIPCFLAAQPYLPNTQLEMLYDSSYIRKNKILRVEAKKCMTSMDSFSTDSFGLHHTNIIFHWKEIYSFDSTGKIERFEYFANDTNLAETITYSYEKGTGKLIEKKQVGGGDRIDNYEYSGDKLIKHTLLFKNTGNQLTETYSYNEEGNLVEVVGRMGNDSLYERLHYSYPKSSKKMKMILLNEEQRLNDGWSVKITRYSYSSNQLKRIEMDPPGRSIEISYSKFGIASIKEMVKRKIETEIECSYNSSGILLSDKTQSFQQRRTIDTEYVTTFQ